MKNFCYILICISLLVSCGKKKKLEVKASQIIIKKNYQVTFNYQPLVGLEAEEGITRRDPSDVIFANDQYYLWYTKTDKGFSGYDASVWYAVSKDGLDWEEKGEAIPKGREGAWDSYSVFTPNVFKANGKFYLLYTGVKPTPRNKDGVFENNATTDITALGLMVSDTPKGSFTRVSENPILEISHSTASFDSYRIDDACVVYRDQKYWLYYKGRSAKYGTDGPSHTKMGVAISSKPEGPYIKYNENPITNGGHEVMVWPAGSGVKTMLSSHGEDGRTLQYAEDGVNFSIIGKIDEDYPKAPGYFRFDDFKDEPVQLDKLSWGISMFYGNRKDSIWPHLLRYEMKIKN